MMAGGRNKQSKLLTITFPGKKYVSNNHQSPLQNATANTERMTSFGSTIVSFLSFVEDLTMCIYYYSVKLVVFTLTSLRQLRQPNREQLHDVPV